MAAVKDAFDQTTTAAKSFMATAPIGVKASILAAGGAAQGGVLGYIMGGLTKDLAKQMANAPQQPGMPPPPQMPFSGTPLQLARNFAVMTGVNAGLHAIIKHARGGKDDVKTLMGASFGSGAAFSLVSGLSQGNKLTGAATMGVSFALIQGLFYQIGQAIGGGNNDDDSEYDATRAMLFALDLSKYEKNFKKNQLNDRTLTLLTEETLKDSKVPPGPRLLILDHVANTDYSYLKLAVPPPPPPGSATAGAAPTKGAAPALPGLASAY